MHMHIYISVCLHVCHVYSKVLLRLFIIHVHVKIMLIKFEKFIKMSSAEI